MDNHAQEMVDLLREQNQLLKKHLWRLRFSLFSLLVLTTTSCIMLGYVAYRTRPSTASVMPLPAPATGVYQLYQQPSANLRYSGSTVIPPTSVDQVPVSLPNPE